MTRTFEKILDDVVEEMREAGRQEIYDRLGMVTLLDDPDCKIRISRNFFEKAHASRCPFAHMWQDIGDSLNDGELES